MAENTEPQAEETETEVEAEAQETEVEAHAASVLPLQGMGAQEPDGILMSKSTLSVGC